MYTAKLTGSDGYVVTKTFTTIPDGRAWLQGDGLQEFGGEAVRGDLLSINGEVVWGKSNLRTPERAERIRRFEAHRLLARLGGLPARQPQAEAAGKKQVEPFKQSKGKEGICLPPWPKRKPTAFKDWREAEREFKRWRDQRVPVTLAKVELPEDEGDD